MADELARGEHGGHQLRPVDQGVEPALEQPDHMGTGIALHADGFGVDAVELALGNIAVIAPQFLLGAQLHAVVGKLAFAALAVLAGTILAAVDGALGAAPHVLPHTAVDLVLRLVALGHRVLMCCVVEDRALLCPGLARNRQVLAEAAPKTAGSRNAAQARPVWRRVSRGKAGSCQTASILSPGRCRFRLNRVGVCVWSEDTESGAGCR